jgi:hypothetical protein
VLNVPNASDEHHAQLLGPVGLADALVLLGVALGEVGVEVGEVGVELGEVGLLGEVGRGDGELWPWPVRPPVPQRRAERSRQASAASIRPKITSQIPRITARVTRVRPG